MIVTLPPNASAAWPLPQQVQARLTVQQSVMVLTFDPKAFVDILPALHLPMPWKQQSHDRQLPICHIFLKLLILFRLPQLVEWMILQNWP